MKITLDKSEIEDYFYRSLCNSLGTFEQSGLELNAKPEDYEAAKESLKAKNPTNTICYEDVFMEVLRMGKKLYVKDIEGEGDNDSEVSLADIHERMELVPQHNLMDMHEENDDAITGDCILQTIFFKEIIFG